VGAAIAAARDGDRVELRLDPPELGRVSIDIRIEDGRLSAVLGAERPETLDLMRRHADALQRELSAAGYDRAQLSFGGGDADARRDPGPPPRAAAPYPEAGPAAAPPAPRRDGQGGLDIRL
jgi:hypothetical protein